MKRIVAALFIMVFAAATLYAFEFFFISPHHPPVLFMKLRLTFWMNFAVCGIAWILARAFLKLFSRPLPVSASSKKEMELEEKLAYLSKIYQELSNSFRLEKQKVESVLGCAPDGIFTCASDGVITSWNRSMESMTGVRMEEAAGKHYADCLRFFSPQGDPLENLLIPCLTRGENVSVLDCRIDIANGNSFPAALGAAPVQQGELGAEPIIITVKDIQAQKELEKFKQEMMAMITHDLRSPLSAMLGYAGLIRNSKLCPGKEERIKYAEAIVRSGKGMLFLINNLLQLASVEDGRVSVFEEPVSVKTLLDEVADNLEVLAREKNISMTVQASPDAAVFSDKEKLQEILVNLISNAVKFSREGETIRLWVAEEKDQVRIAVSDSGPGISQEEKTKLFEKFSSVRKRGSVTGLGLYIASKLIATLGGSIDVESEEGKGSTFMIVLPAYKKTEPIEPPTQLSLLTKT